MMTAFVPAAPPVALPQWPPPPPSSPADDDDALSVVTALDGVAMASASDADGDGDDGDDDRNDDLGDDSPAAEGAFLDRLLSPTPAESLTPAHVTRVGGRTLHATLPLLLAVIARVGDTAGARAAAVALAVALRQRLEAGRALKLRFLLLARTPGYRRWRVRLTYAPDAYVVGAAVLAAARWRVAAPSPSLSSCGSSLSRCSTVGGGGGGGGGRPPRRRSAPSHAPAARGA